MVTVYSPSMYNSPNDYPNIFAQANDSGHSNLNWHFVAVYYFAEF